MRKFFGEAIQAALLAEGQVSQWKPGNDLGTWPQVAAALNALTPRQRCHAVYADWLLQLHEPGGDTQIQVRDLLLGEGALAANYLAELAQNADDSKATTLHVALEEDWLLVANNGRHLSSLNLLGLCRFFVHSDGQVIGLTPDTIGRFGIGFKACHRVAQEVLVWSWGTEQEFGFRLPICHGGGDASKPNQETLNNLRHILESIGKPVSELRAIDQLGHCTPEALPIIPERLPDALRRRIDHFRGENEGQGVWFALHLHERGLKEAEERIDGQSEALYELCPLFLNNLRSVTLQDRTMKMAVGTPIGTDVGTVNARRITLAVTDHDGSTRNDRLLMLTGENNSKWKVALPADSDFRLKSPSADQFSLRSGGGYAYFPLPALTWPWRVHLHLACRTNLARSDWNANDHAAIHENLIAAANGLAGWTTGNPELWHPSWQPPDVLSQSAFGNQPESSAWVFAEAFTRSLSDAQSLRTLWGTLTTPALACGLMLEPGQAVHDAWEKISQFVPLTLQEQFPLVLAVESVAHFNLPRLKTEKAKEVFGALRVGNHDETFWRSFMLAVLGSVAESSGGYSRSAMIEDLLGSVPLDRPADTPITMEQASQSRFAVRLTQEWHEWFRRLSANWLDANSTLADLTVFGMRISQVLRVLASPAEAPTVWDEVLRMTEVDFRTLGDAFWTVPRAPCPPPLAEGAIRAIWVESGRDWLPLAEMWIGSEPIAMLKGIVRSFDRRPGEVNNQRRNKMESSMTQWSLQTEYEKSLLRRVEEQALPEFQRRLKDENPANPSRLKMLILAANWKPNALPLAWREPVLKAAKAAITQLFEQSGLGNQRGRKLLVGGAIPRIMAWLPDYLEAPAWLEPDAIRQIEDQGILRDLGLSCMVLNGINQDQKTELGKQLLEGFRHWPQVPHEPPTLSTLRELFRGATNTWTVGYAGGAAKRLNEHCCWIQPKHPQEVMTPQECVIAGAEPPELNGGLFLPEALAAVPEIREKCFQVSNLIPEFTCPEGDEIVTIVEAEIPEAMTKNPWFLRLRQLLPNASIVSLAGRQRIKWKRGELELVISKATFGLCKTNDLEAIFIADSNRQAVPADNNRYLPVLVAYTQVAPDDKVIAKSVRNNRGLRKIYLEHRAKIRARLVQAHATDMGYEAEHVMRELLQNAESAYASRRVELLCEPAIFEVSAKSEDHGTAWNVDIVHFGRAFNEQDNSGNERSDDIDRLCALAGPQNRTSEEVGRFNRGFKSVFQVTNEVNVVSGGYSFKIEDLLLLDPAEPVRDQENNDKATRFTFEVNADKKPKLFRENGGREHAFEAIELVFLRHVSLVVIKISGKSERRFEIERGEKSNEWQTIKIHEHDGKQITITRFLVCQRRDDHENRIAVAIALGDTELPKLIPEDARYFYRTFPLKQKAAWFPFLLNADFLTDHGRSGLSPNPENDAFIVCGLQMLLSLVRNRIEDGGGDIDGWLSWVNALERRKLAEGGGIVATQRKTFETALCEFDSWLWLHLPDGTALRPAAEFCFPSRLVRRLHEMPEWSDEFNFDAKNWVAYEVAEALNAFGSLPQSNYSLQSQVARLISEGSDKEELRRCLEAVQRLELAQDVVSRIEIDAALGLVARHQIAQFKELLELTPDGYPQFPETEEVGIGIEAADLLAAWNETEALKEFTLEGWMGGLVFSGLNADAQSKQRSILEGTSSLEGKECWYRLFCLGSLLGARALPQTVRRFWEMQLEPRCIFDATTGGRDLAKVLDEISHRSFADLDATGENAEMWRRVFYDFQKLRLFVFEDDLPGAFLEHVKTSDDWDGPINYLKSGFRKEGDRWAGVLGQSMTTPMFWIMRELRRIKLIDSEAFNASCLYLNGPARRVAVQLRWLDEEDRKAYRFEQLLTLGETCFASIKEELGDDMANFFDLPLQWYAFNKSR